MAEETLDFGERMARAEQAFRLTAIEGLSMRAAAKQMDCSPATVSRDAKAYRDYLVSERRDVNLDDKRAKIEAVLDDIRAKALEVYSKSGKELAKIGALNTVAATVAHYRAINGLDTAKEVKADIETDITIKWQE